jgi:hypothetical protein
LNGYHPPPGAWAPQPGPQTDAIVLRDAPELLFGGARGGGKALALDTPIATPGGWALMGELQVGDTVFDETGAQCIARAVSPIMHGRVCYRLTFSDGAQIVADAEHGWRINGEFRTTRDIAVTCGQRLAVDARRHVEACERVPSVPVRCIQVDSPSHLYLAGEQGIPTHNSDYLLGDFCQDVGQGRAWRGLIARRSYPELEELITRSQTLIPMTWPGSDWMKSEKTWLFPTGASLRMRSLEAPEDVAKFWGHQYSWLGFDELGAFSSDAVLRQLSACLRSAEPVEAMRIRATANPGGVGHHWIKARYIDPAPGGYVPIKDPATGTTRVFIPSRVTDNRVLLARDPGYVDRLKGVGSPELVRSWLLGDWSVVIGSFYPEFGPQHIRRPFAIPRHWLRFRAFDWGSAKPFACLWLAVSDGDVPNVPRGALIVYRELYGASAPNVGLRLSAEQVADRIREHELADEPVQYSVADPAIFTRDGGPSIMERMSTRGVTFQRGDNARVAREGTVGGWDMLRQRLIGEDDTPMLYMFSTCANLIRTLPALQHDPRRQDDVDSDGDDHLSDALRYAVMSRPWVRAEQTRPQSVTLETLWRLRETERLY